MSEKTVAPITPGQEKFIRPILRWISRANVWVYKASNGRIGGKFIGGAPVCLLTMTGRKSGRRLTTPLIYVPVGDDVILVASQGGMSKNPVWYGNLLADPNVEIQWQGEVRRMTARQASDAEKQALWPELLAVYPDFDDYQTRTERNIPVMICSPAQD